MLNHPHSLVSLSDAGAHLTFFNDAGFGLHLMGHWARELGAMSMAEAVRRLTSQPAQVFGMQRRGLIREGYAADLLLFDPETVARGPKRRVFDLPGGAARLTTDAVGVHGVWVNGRMVADAKGLVAGAARRRTADGVRVRSEDRRRDYSRQVAVVVDVFARLEPADPLRPALAGPQVVDSALARTVDRAVHGR